MSAIPHQPGGEGSGLRPASRADVAGLPVDVAPRLLGGILEVTVDGETVAVRLTEVEAYHGRGTGSVPDPGSHARMGPTARNATMWGEPGHLYVYLSHGIHSCVNVVCGPEGTAGGILLRAGEIVSGRDAAARRRTATRVPVSAAAVASPSVPAGVASGPSVPAGVASGPSVPAGAASGPLVPAGAASGPPVPAGVASSPRALPDRDLARGPGRLGQAVGLRHPVHDGIDAITSEPRAGAVARLLLPDEPLPETVAGPRVGVAGVAGTAVFPWRFWIDGDPTVSAFRWGRGAREADTRNT
ncbi:DNA-3-methyladenine glycosylase [Microbacterium sp. SLBN-154]|uniref:DNA-3-methyladenine glycosylase n=1 Tax=Microbacterium sp. SLBN-154 TaxID=2768458 RepID=UPI00116DFD2C|nr:DNA-3-methyladenine glycosylase [Microbacterium sp. SLBN-154]TQK18156.1 DNA-3-methyladenine glycosylase [Microbacterium sp. SLBN-154]